MPQASITINAVPGSDDNLPIANLVQLNNQDIGGETSYLWAILDQPPGAVDTLSNPAIKNPTFTPNKEGSYLIRLIVNFGAGDEQQDQVVAAVRQVKTLERIPAAGETVEVDTSDGWATAMNALLRQIDAFIADPAVIVGVNTNGSSITKGDVLRVTSGAIIKVGLPGQEIVPGYVKAPATTIGNLDELLSVMVSKVGGGNTANDGEMINTRYVGKILSLPLGAGAVGDTVYVSDTATISTTAGTIRRRIGSIMAVSGGNRDVWFDGIGGQDITPIDAPYVVYGSGGMLTAAHRIDGTSADGAIGGVPHTFKAGDVSTVALVAKRFGASAGAIFELRAETDSPIVRFASDGTVDQTGLTNPLIVKRNDTSTEMLRLQGGATATRAWMSLYPNATRLGRIGFLGGTTDIAIENEDATAASDIRLATANGSFRQEDAVVLGSSASNYRLLSDTIWPVGASDNMHRQEFTFRRFAGSNWQTGYLHDSIGVNALYQTPGTDTKTWWERDPYDGYHYLGNAARKYLSAGPNGLGVNGDASGVLTVYDPGETNIRFSVTGTNTANENTEVSIRSRGSPANAFLHLEAGSGYPQWSFGHLSDGTFQFSNTDVSVVTRTILKSRLSTNDFFTTFENTVTGESKLGVVESYDADDFSATSCRRFIVQQDTDSTSVPLMRILYGHEVSPTASMNFYVNSVGASILGLSKPMSFGTSSAHNAAIITNATERLRVTSDGRLIGGAYSGTTPDIPIHLAQGGLLLDMNTSDNDIMQLAVDTVAHGMTTFVETDVYGSFGREVDADGGLRINGWTETSIGIGLYGNATTPGATTADSATGCVMVRAYKKSGTTRTALGTGENVFAAANATTTVMVLKGDGMLYVNADAGGTDYYVGIWDEEQDAIACRDLAYGLGGRWDKVLAYQAPALEKMGIMKDGFLSVQASTALTLSGVSEVYQVLDRLCRRFGLTYEQLRQEVRQCQKA